MTMNLRTMSKYRSTAGSFFLRKFTSDVGPDLYFSDEFWDEDTALESGFAFDEDDEEDMEIRAPVVTIMGHVGKTFLR